MSGEKIGLIPPAKLYNGSQNTSKRLLEFNQIDTPFGLGINVIIFFILQAFEAYFLPSGTKTFIFRACREHKARK